MIVSQGQINTASLIVPDLYVQIVPPQTYLLQGVPTNLVGMVGSASWGPVNQPVIVGNMPDFITKFGTPVARKFDVGTHVATAIQQGASNFRIVRVTDGTDVAASSTGVTGAITFAAKYTGSLGNALKVQISTGSKASSWRCTIGVPGSRGEIFDNISGTGNAFWVALAAAINLGNGVLRGPSNLVVATSAAGTTAVAAGTYSFTGGTDGVGTFTAATVIGADTGARSGIYSLRGLGCGILVAADVDDTTQWTTLDGFANGEGCYNIVAGPSGDTITNAITTKQTAGVDDYSTKVLLGDWLLWNDQFNSVQRYISPQGFVAGRLANLSPEQSGLNKQIYAVAGSQRSNSTAATYSQAELSALVTACIDVVTNPGAGGLFIWTLRFGHNSASNKAVGGDNYTRLINFIAASLNAGMGIYLGKPITPDLCRNVKATLDAFLLGLVGQGILGIDVDDGGLPYSVVCGFGKGTNNPPERTKLGYLQADCQVQFQAITEELIVNLEGGQTVSVTRQVTQTQQIAV